MLKQAVRVCGLVIAGGLLGSSWPLLSSRLRPELPMYESRILPEPYPIGRPSGILGTGLASGGDGQFWAGMGLANVDPSAGVALIAPGFSRVLQVCNVTKLGLPPSSVQGVAPRRDGIWFISKNRTRGKLVEVDKHCHLQRSADVVHPGPNGLAYDSKRDALILLHDDRTVQWLDAKTLRPIGIMGEIKGKGPDHLFYDAGTDRIYVTSGPNRENGRLTSYAVPSLEMIANYTLAGADAIEGIAIEGNRIIVLNDAGTHEGLPNVNRALEYRLPQPTGS